VGGGGAVCVNRHCEGVQAQKPKLCVFMGEQFSQTPVT
jgi:hypothetical protein